MLGHEKSHDNHEKVVHRPCSSCISSVQEMHKDSIEFFLLTWIRSGIKLSRLSPYMHRLVRKYEKWSWEEEQKKVFKQLKRVFTT